MNRYAIPLILLFVAMPSAGQSNGGSEFADAWRAYLEAKESGNPAAVIETSRNALDIGREVFPADDQRLPALMSNYGVALYDAGDLAAARPILKESVDLTAEIHGKDSEKMIPVLMNYADARAEFQNSQAMERTYNQALKVAEKNWGRESLDYAGISLRAGINIFEQARSDEAGKYLRRSNKIFTDLVGEEDIRTAYARFFLGKMEMTKRDYRDATNFFLSALPGFGGDSDAAREFEIITRSFLVQAYESRGMSDEATEHCLVVGQKSMLSPDQDYQPLFRKAPAYPRPMLISNIQGHVDFAFTVDENGFVRDPEVIDAVGNDAFIEPALEALRGFRYAPQFRDGQPVVVDDVKTRITFRLVD